MNEVREKEIRKVFGEVAEWSIAAVLKTVEGNTSRGSNPCLSAGKVLVISIL